jgi:DDE superfamily endonuclease
MDLELATHSESDDDVQPFEGYGGQMIASTVQLSALLLRVRDSGNQAAAAAAILFNCGVLECDEADYSVVETRQKLPRLQLLLEGHISIFRSATGFTPSEFEELCRRTVPAITIFARSTGSPKAKEGRPPKLSPPERLLAFVIVAKHNNCFRYEAAIWNHSRSSSCVDAYFMSTVINHALSNELEWPSEHRRAQLGSRLAEFPGCIGHIDGTLCRIQRPRIENHKSYYNKRKEMYCFNNVVIVDHYGLFIYCDAGYAGSFHDVRCLRASHIHANWRNYFRNSPDEVQEYVLGDPGYMGAEMYILRRIDRREQPQHENGDLVAEAFNRRHASKRVQVEWGIGGLKSRFRRFLGIFPCRRDAFATYFEACARLTNFIHRRRLDFTITDLGYSALNEIDEDGPFNPNWG